MPMKIAYVLHWNLGRNDGVTQKIRTQIEAWTAAGCDARVFCLTPTVSHPVGLHETTLFEFTSNRTRITASTMLARAVRNWAPELLYCRYMSLLPSLVRLFRTFPVVVEINSDIINEAHMRLGPCMRMLNKLSYTGMLRLCDGVVCVSNELRNRVVSSGCSNRIEVIANGIDLDATAFLQAPTNKRPRVIFAGTDSSPWHGVDKILWLARRLPCFDFDIVGDLSVGKNDSPNNVCVHGFQSGDVLRETLATADAAFGTLALHRKAMNEACPLKVRLYLASGIPTIIAYDDTDFPNEHEFLLRLPNREDNIESAVTNIRDFVLRMQGVRVERGRISNNICAADKEARRLTFVSSVLKEYQTRSSLQVE